MFNPFPVTERLLCYFVVHLAEEGLSHQNILGGRVRCSYFTGFPDLRFTDNVLGTIQAGIQQVQALKGWPKKVHLPIT